MKAAESAETKIYANPMAGIFRSVTWRAVRGAASVQTKRPCRGGGSSWCICCGQCTHSRGRKSRVIAHYLQ